MCSLAPRTAAAAPGFGATTFLGRHRGVVATVAPAAATSRHNAGELTRRHACASEASAAPARKRGRHDVVVDPAASSSALRIRMDAELVALHGIIKRAKLLPRSAPPVKKKCTAAKNPMAPEVPDNKQRPVEAPAAVKQQTHQHPIQRAAVAKTEVQKKRRPEEEEEELARAAAREQFRQMLREMEKAALPDETIYPEDLAKLGIPFEFNMTRTWKQACLDAKKVELVS